MEEDIKSRRPKTVKVLLAHNYYQQRGGEDEVFANEGAILEAHGHQVVCYTAHNDQIAGLRALTLARNTIWNRATYEKLRSLARESRPQVAHFHNTFPLISPAAYQAAKEEGVPVVQTLHNYRLLCPNALFFRDGRVCEDCMGKALPWPGVVHACYRESRVASGVVAGMLSVHRASDTWKNVDMYVVPTRFARNKFVEGGLPESKITVKPNFVHPDPGLGSGGGGYALFVGRLSVEKGINSLIAAWRHIRGRLPLKIVGDGPLATDVKNAAARIEGVEWLGRKSAKEVYELMGEASMLVIPSECYETFGRVAAEALAKGTPVIAADTGAVAEMVEHGRTGLVFRYGVLQDLVAQLEWALAHPQRLAAMRREARAEFEAKYTAEHNYRMLMKIYESIIDRHAAHLSVPG